LTDLETAIMNTFNGNAALLAAATGGMHNTESPSNADYPRIVFNIVAGIKSNTFSHEYENISVDFRIYTQSNSSVSLNNLFALLISLYDDLRMTVNNYTTVEMRRTVYNKTKDETDESVWIYLVSYKVVLEKT